MIRIFRVSGASMEPDYREGDFVLVLTRTNEEVQTRNSDCIFSSGLWSID